MQKNFLCYKKLERFHAYACFFVPIRERERSEHKSFAIAKAFGEALRSKEPSVASAETSTTVRASSIRISSAPYACVCVFFCFYTIIYLEIRKGFCLVYL